MSTVGHTQRRFVTQVAVLPCHPSELVVTESDGDPYLLQKAMEGLTGCESPVQGEGKLISDILAANGEWEMRGHARSLVPFEGILPPCSPATLPISGSASPAVSYSPAPRSYTEHFHWAPTANPATEEVAMSG